MKASAQRVKSLKIDYEANSPFLAFVHFHKFLLLMAKYSTKVADKPKCKQHPHVANAFSYPRNIYKHVEHHGKLTFCQ